MKKWNNGMTILKMVLFVRASYHYLFAMIILDVRIINYGEVRIMEDI